MFVSATSGKVVCSYCGFPLTVQSFELILWSLEMADLRINCSMLLHSCFMLSLRTQNWSLQYKWGKQLDLDYLFLPHYWLCWFGIVGLLSKVMCWLNYCCFLMFSIIKFGTWIHEKTLKFVCQIVKSIKNFRTV